MVDALFSLEKIESQHLPQVGEQALQLSVFAQKGFQVLPSIVLSATRFRNFLETIHWIQPLFADLSYSSLRLNLEDSQQLQSIARQIRQTIQHAELPEAWLSEIQTEFSKISDLGTAAILRPSIAFDRELPSQELTDLIEPQICSPEKNSLAIALKQLWAELFRARNLIYWQGTKLELHQIHLAVLIQPIDSAIASGSLQGTPPNWEVTATRGLSVAIARGEVLPEIYKISEDQIQFQQAGRQTIAYQIQTGDPPLIRSTICETASVLTAQQREAILSLAQMLQFRAAVDWQFYDSQLYITTVRDSNLDINAQAVSHPEKAIVTGLAAAPGTAIASAFVLKDLNLTEAPIPASSVLVTPMILPDWIPLLKHVAAIVAEQGGMTSHGAMLAREMGIPAIVGAEGATQRIQTGETISVNGNTGIVTIASQIPKATPETIQMNPIWNATATQLMINLSQLNS
ncbi:hypothetical protein IQ250_24145, partial [Pseudanabaenaceae cyanobacterium LEGE 13415]|nr:hypothetical protein [Pseudanabaenaceae cyanobacterium LEGE 13415]